VGLDTEICIWNIPFEVFSANEVKKSLPSKYVVGKVLVPPASIDIEDTVTLPDPLGVPVPKYTI
jgi:hypothetical protein